MAGFLVGAATGGVLFGWLGDRIGRVRAMTLSVLTYAVFTGLCGFAGEAVADRRACGSSRRWAWAANGRSAWRWSWKSGRTSSRAFMAGLIGAAANVGYLLVGLHRPGAARLARHDSRADCSAVGLSRGRGRIARRANQRLAADDDAGHGAGAAHVFHPHVRARIGEVGEGAGEAAATSHWATQDLLGVLRRTWRDRR